MNVTQLETPGSQAQRIRELPLDERNKLFALYERARQLNPNAWCLAWNEDGVVYVQEARESSLRAIANALLRPAIESMQTASGLTRDQAKTCVYYAVATFLQDEFYSELMPILLLQGNSGTGKSEALKQLAKLVNAPKWIQGRTYSDVGNSINRATSAIIDEGDYKQDRIETELLQLRCCRRYANQVIHIPPAQGGLPIYNFGATVIVRRSPFTDTATRNRTIIVKTQRRPGTYRLTDIDNSGVSAMAEIIRRNRSQVTASDRVNDSWRPVTEIASTIGDTEWLAYQFGELRKAQLMLAAGDQYEPEDVLVKAILTCCNGNFSQAIKLKDIRAKLEDFDVTWTTQKIHAMVLSLGFTVRFYQGYDHVAANNDLLGTLARERGIEWEAPAQG